MPQRMLGGMKHPCSFGSTEPLPILCVSGNNPCYVPSAYERKKYLGTWQVWQNNKVKFFLIPTILALTNEKMSLAKHIKEVLQEQERKKGVPKTILVQTIKKRGKLLKTPKRLSEVCAKSCQIDYLSWFFTKWDTFCWKVDENTETLKFILKFAKKSQFT